MLNTAPRLGLHVNHHERDRVVESIAQGLPFWVQLDLAELLLTSGRCGNAPELIESLRLRLMVRRGLVRDYSNERPVPSHMWDAPPLPGERRLVHEGECAGTLTTWGRRSPGETLTTWTPDPNRGGVQ